MLLFIYLFILFHCRKFSMIYYSALPLCTMYLFIHFIYLFISRQWFIILFCLSAFFFLFFLTKGFGLSHVHKVKWQKYIACSLWTSKDVPPPDIWLELVQHCLSYRKKTDAELDVIDKEVFSLRELLCWDVRFPIYLKSEQELKDHG